MIMASAKRISATSTRPVRSTKTNIIMDSFVSLTQIATLSIRRHSLRSRRHFRGMPALTTAVSHGTVTSRHTTQRHCAVSVAVRQGRNFGMARALVAAHCRLSIYREDANMRTINPVFRHRVLTETWFPQSCCGRYGALRKLRQSSFNGTGSRP